MKRKGMMDEVAGLKPGKVALRHFELLVAGTNIRGVDVIAALLDHLVNGVKAFEAWKIHGLNPGQFYARLKVIQAESARAQEISAYYPKKRATSKSVAETEVDVEPVAIEVMPKAAPKKKAVPKEK